MGKESRHEVTIYRGDNRRRLVPQAVCAALTALIDDEGVDPSTRRVELRELRSRLVRLYELDDPMAPARDTDVSHLNAEEDGDAFPE